MYDDATCVAWSGDSRWVIVGSKDLTARVYSANHMEAWGGEGGKGQSAFTARVFIYFFFSSFFFFHVA